MAEMKIRLPQSRMNALETAQGQLRSARKNLLVASLPGDMEDAMLERFVVLTSELGKIIGMCEVATVVEEKTVSGDVVVTTTTQTVIPKKPAVNEAPVEDPRTPTQRFEDALGYLETVFTPGEKYPTVTLLKTLQTAGIIDLYDKLLSDGHFVRSDVNGQSFVNCVQLKPQEQKEGRVEEGRVGALSGSR